MTRSCAARVPISCELALGMDTTLEATERELGEVRAILRSAVEELMVEFGQRALKEGVVGMEFQDLSDQLLANAQRRIELVRDALAATSPRPSGEGTP